jgi:MFS family permease
VVQGAAATSLIPGSLSTLTQAFPDPARRAQIYGLWGGCGSLAVALGPVIGGVLVDEVGWWAIFLIDLPIGILAIMLGARYIPESADPAHAAVDRLGQGAGILWLGALTYGLIEAGGFLPLPRRTSPHSSSGSAPIVCSLSCPSIFRTSRATRPYRLGCGTCRYAVLSPS